VIPSIERRLHMGEKGEGILTVNRDVTLSPWRGWVTREEGDDAMSDSLE
jgi:hypothetical protein